MEKLYKKSELAFALVMIGAYVTLMSVSDGVSELIGVKKAVTAPICAVFSAVIIAFIMKNGLKEKYGLCAAKIPAKKLIYYIPLIFSAATNMWFGLYINYSCAETVLYVAGMLFTGFLEEIIFRGFLFKALLKDGVKKAVIISSLTFGAGHAVNLINGAEPFSTLLQICYAAAIGFLFTVIFYKTGSIVAAAVTHSAINALSAFSNKNMPVWGEVAVSVFLCVVCIAYAAYIIRVAENKPPLKQKT